MRQRIIVRRAKNCAVSTASRSLALLPLGSPALPRSRPLPPGWWVQRARDGGCASDGGEMRVFLGVAEGRVIAVTETEVIVKPGCMLDGSALTPLLRPCTDWHVSA